MKPTRTRIEVLKQSPVGGAIRLFKAGWSFLDGTASGLREYHRGGQISKGNWEKLLRAHCASNGRLTSLLSPLLRVMRPPRNPAPVTGLLGHFNVDCQRMIVSTLRRDGFYVFPSLMPVEICDEIEAFAAATPAVTEFNRAQNLALEKYDPRLPLSRTYKIRESDSINSPAIQKLIGDQAFIAIAEQYLRTQPSIGGIDVWWSALYGNEPGNDAAQLFHFDFDAPPAWLKLFVYIKDVSSDNGPHVYVRGTHRAGVRGARALRARGYERISDDDIGKAFGRDAVTPIHGPRGTVFMADTRGFHKGQMPATSDRLLAQVIYCSPLFNDHATATKFPQSLDPQLAAALDRVPHVYERFL
jgi:hypothetical protein